MKIIFDEKATIADPSGYKDKLKTLIRADKNLNEMRRMNSSSSMGSLFSKS